MYTVHGTRYTGVPKNTSTGRLHHQVHSRHDHHHHHHCIADDETIINIVFTGLQQDLAPSSPPGDTWRRLETRSTHLSPQSGIGIKSKSCCEVFNFPIRQPKHRIWSRIGKDQIPTHNTCTTREGTSAGAPSFALNREGQTLEVSDT